jgi:dolichol-phosphate mannosyltransferase
MSGARAARGETLLVMDADLSHLPDRIKDLVAPLFAGTADLVVGNRYVKGGSNQAGQYGAGLRLEQGGACLSAHWLARFHVRLLCDRSFAVAGIRAANQRFQNCF